MKKILIRAGWDYEFEGAYWRTSKDFLELPEETKIKFYDEMIEQLIYDRDFTKNQLEKFKNKKI